MAYFVNDVIQHQEMVIDSAGVVVESAPVDFTMNIGSVEVGISYLGTFGAPARHLFSFTPTIPGQYSFAATWMIDGQEEYYTEYFDVDAVPVPISAPTYIGAGQGTPLHEIRRMCARKNGDYRKLTARTTGSEGVIFDHMGLVENTDHFRGAELIFTSEPHLWEVRRSIGNSTNTFSLSFVPPLASPTITGETVDVFNFSRNGHSIQDYDDAINDAIRFGFPENRIEVKQVLDDEFTGDPFVVPDVFTHLYGVSFTDDSGYEYDLMNSRYPDSSSGWYYDAVSRTIKVGWGDNWGFRGGAITLYGYGREATMVHNTDVTYTDPEWIVEHVASILSMGQMDQSTFPIGQAWMNRADSLRAKMAKVGKPNTIRL
jgi:hypothetical protein